MKKILGFNIILLIVHINSMAQYPANFSWGKYITPVDDQKRQGPCFVFAAVGGVEAMHNLYFGTGSIDLSERQVYSCGHPSGVGDITTAVSYISTYGAIPATCAPYPTEACSGLSDNGPGRLVFQSYDCSALQINCAAQKRIKISYQDVTANIAAGAESIKSVLVNKGPIMLAFSSSALHTGAMHGYVLYGWTTVNGQLRWILRDSWPCDPQTALQSTVDLSTVSSNHAYVVTAVTEERYSSGWYNANLPIKPFELEPENQIVKINSPSSCYNQGTYTLSGLEKISGATLIGWSIRNSYDYSSSATISSNGVLTGDAASVTVVATIQRPNGLQENITKVVGPVGVPVNVTKPVDWCPMTGRREITLTANALTPANSTTSIQFNIPASTNGSYYVINGGSSQYLVFFSTTAINYTVSVQNTAPGGCATSFSTYRYVVAMPCGSYYRESLETVDSVNSSDDASKNQNIRIIFPNPAKNSLTIHPLGSGRNDVILRTLLGSEAYVTRISQVTEIDVSRFERGIYIVEVKSRDGKQTQRAKVVLE
jgi:hypothetical protein